MAGDEAGVTLGQPHLSRQDLGSLVRGGWGRGRCRDRWVGSPQRPGAVWPRSSHASERCCRRRGRVLAPKGLPRLRASLLGAAALLGAFIARLLPVCSSAPVAVRGLARGRGGSAATCRAPAPREARRGQKLPPTRAFYSCGTREQGGWCYKAVLGDTINTQTAEMRCLARCCQ